LSLFSRPAQQRAERELSSAGQSQATHLPGELPELPGWQSTPTPRLANELRGGVLAALSGFVARAPQSNDITVLVVRRVAPRTHHS